MSFKNVNYDNKEVRTIDNVTTRYREQCVGYELVDGVDHAVCERYWGVATDVAVRACWVRDLAIFILVFVLTTLGLRNTNSGVRTSGRSEVPTADILRAVRFGANLY